MNITFLKALPTYRDGQDYSFQVDDINITVEISGTAEAIFGASQKIIESHARNIIERVCRDLKRIPDKIVITSDGILVDKTYVLDSDMVKILLTLNMKS